MPGKKNQQRHGLSSTSASESESDPVPENISKRKNNSKTPSKTSKSKSYKRIKLLPSSSSSDDDGIIFLEKVKSTEVTPVKKNRIKKKKKLNVRETGTSSGTRNKKSRKSFSSSSSSSQESLSHISGDDNNKASSSSKNLGKSKRRRKKKNSNDSGCHLTEEQIESDKSDNFEFADRTTCVIEIDSDYENETQKIQEVREDTEEEVEEISADDNENDDEEEQGVHLENGDFISHNNEQDSLNSTSSESASDAENEIQPNLQLPDEDDPFLEVICLDDDPLIDDYLDKVPIAPPGSKIDEYQVKIGVHNSTEFSVAVYKEHYQTFKRNHQYPQEFIDFLLNIDRSLWRYNSEENIFVISLTKTLYKLVTEALKYTEDDSSLESVMETLAFYNAFNKPSFLENKPGYSGFMNRLNELPVWLELLPHQKQAISFAISRGGRCMFADESRMGKRVEAILASYFYREEYPMVVLCPTSLQIIWEDELKRWLPNDENEYKIHNLIGNEECDELLKQDEEIEKKDVVIIGYNLLQKCVELLKKFNFKVMILDHSHRIKHACSKTTKSAIHLIKRSRRRFLLTSNPAFGVPIELFRQLHVINRWTFKNYLMFSDRYCGVDEIINEKGETLYRGSTKWSKAKNLEELQHLLFGTVAIRTHREELVQHQNCRVKQREKVLLNFDPDIRTRRILGEIYGRSKSDLFAIQEGQTKNAKIFMWYKKSGGAKVLGICKYLDDFDLENRKTIIYARHKFVLEGIVKLLKTKKIKYRRIKGDYKQRLDLCQQFNHKKKVRVALLNMGISNVNVELDAADTIIFTELYWVPEDLFRNEDRAFKLFYPHKLERPKSVEVKYLISSDLNPGSATDQIHIDSHLWESLAGKLDVLKKLGLINNDFSFTMPESRFEPESSSITDNLKFSDISSGGSNSEGEYNPEDDSEAGLMSESDSESSIHSDQLSDQDTPEVESDTAPGHENSSQENEEEEMTSQSQSQEIEDPVERTPSPSIVVEDDENSTQIKTPTTRSQTAERRAARQASNVESSESCQEDDEESNASGSSSEEEVVATSSRAGCRRVDNSDSERSSDDESESSLDGFVVKSPGDDGSSETLDEDYIPDKKRKKKKKHKKREEKSKKKKIKTVSFGKPDHRRNRSDSSSESEEEERNYSPKDVQKKAKSFFF